MEQFAKLLASEAERVSDPLAALTFLAAYLRQFTSFNTSESKQPDLTYYDMDPITVSGYAQLLVASAVACSPSDPADWYFQAENSKYIDMLIKLIR